MTIKGLNKFLKDRGITSTNVHLNKFAGRKVAIDAQGFLYVYQYGAVKANSCVFTKLKDRTIYIDDVIDRFVKLDEKLKGYGIEHLFVFDGAACQEKKETQMKRREGMKKNKEAAEKNPTLKNIEKDIRFEGDEVKTIIKTLTEKGINVIVDPIREAECLCAKLAKEGKTDWVWTIDCDAVAHLCPYVIRKLNKDDTVEVITLKTILRKLEMKHDPKLLVAFCVCCGTDYNKNIKGLGPSGLFKLIEDSSFNRHTFVKQMKKKDGFQDINYQRVMKLFNSEKDENFLLK